MFGQNTDNPKSNKLRGKNTFIHLHFLNIAMENLDQQSRLKNSQNYNRIDHGNTTNTKNHHATQLGEFVVSTQHIMNPQHAFFVSTQTSRPFTT